MIRAMPALAGPDGSRPGMRTAAGDKSVKLWMFAKN